MITVIGIAIGGIVAFVIWKKLGSPTHGQRKRDRAIERNMRLGMRDAEVQERIAKKIADERRQQ
jgi:uncharacterized membrane protein YdjX (TVP38/TMEM64 family)